MPDAETTNAEMKCVCPMGGDRSCPADCLYRKWQNLSASERKEQRKQHFSIPLFQQGYSQDEIAKQLGVNKSTISRDLRDIVAPRNNVRTERGTDTLGRRRSTGRPRGSGRRGEQPQQRRNPLEHAIPRQRQTDNQETQIIARAEAGESSNQIATELGVEGRSVRRVIEAERARRTQAAEPTINPSELSMTAQQKLEAAIRQHKRALDLQFEQRVSAEIRNRLEERIRTLKRMEADYMRGINSHKGYISREKYKAMLRCLHPDSRHAASERWLEEAFNILTGLERILVKRENRETLTQDPSRWTAAAMAARRDTTRQRHARNAPARRPA